MRPPTIGQGDRIFGFFGRQGQANAFRTPPPHFWGPRSKKKPKRSSVVLEKVRDFLKTL